MVPAATARRDGTSEFEMLDIERTAKETRR
jgi:hypothetical protein